MSGEDDSDDDLLRAVAAAPDRRPAEPVMTSGVRIGGFRVLSKLGAGGMGVVYRAEDEQLRREVALKVIAPRAEPDANARRRFLREARSAAAVNHPNVATVFEVGEDDGRIFIAMELASGITLRTMLAERKQLPLDEAVSIARQIARGLAKAHQKGIVHRDLKPDNIMVGELVKVLDFGLARVDDSAAIDVASTATNEIAGTPGYMSPEQTTGGTVDARTDVFAFGVVLYETLAGERPFRGDSGMAVAIAIARDPHVPLSDRRPDVPEDLERIVDRCLEKSPAARYANAKEILDELEALSPTPMPASARASRTAVDAAPPRSKLPALLGVAALFAVALGAWRWSAQAPVTPSAQPTAPAEASLTLPVASASSLTPPASTSSPSMSSTASASAVASAMVPKASVALATARPSVVATTPAVSASSKPRKRNPLDDQE